MHKALELISGTVPRGELSYSTDPELRLYLSISITYKDHNLIRVGNIDLLLIKIEGRKNDADLKGLSDI